jgi:hypothetical protein
MSNGAVDDNGDTLEDAHSSIGPSPAVHIHDVERHDVAHHSWLSAHDDKLIAW